MTEHDAFTLGAMRQARDYMRHLAQRWDDGARGYMPPGASLLALEMAIREAETREPTSRALGEPFRGVRADAIKRGRAAE